MVTLGVELTEYFPAVCVARMAFVVKECDRKKNIQVIWELKTWIRTHLDNVPPVEMLAEGAGMSTRTFHRLFKEVTGTPPAEYVHGLRLAHGASWLAYTNVKVIEAALAAGYDSREAFTRNFKTHYGCTPIQFRERLQKHIQSIDAAPPPKGLRILGIEKCTARPLVAHPHFGTPLSTLSAWTKLGSWAKKKNMLADSSIPAVVIYDDAVVLPPGGRERYDAALILNKPLPSDDVVSPLIQYTIPAGTYAVAEFTGTLLNIESAWDYFSLSWFLKSGLQMRSNLFLTLFEPEDVPVNSLQTAKLLTKRWLKCRLCIPAAELPGDGLPPVGA